MTNEKVAVVTGSGKKRVGWHVAEELARHGYSLAIHYHQSDEEARQTVADFCGRGYRAAAFQADLRDEAAVQSFAAKVLHHFGRIDAVVHCAAIWFPKKLEDVRAADVREFFDANLLSAFLVSQQFGLRMVSQPSGGSIVLVGDWASRRPYVDYSAYFASKGAIPTLTRCLAVELSARNPRIRVNAVLPGPVMLPPSVSPEERERVIQATLVRREGEPRHVALAVRHFLENDFVTGTVLAVDGGRTIA